MATTTKMQQALSIVFWVIHFMVTSANAHATVYKQIAQLENSNSKLLQYPTQFSQNIMPKQIHSHNDCEYEMFLEYSLSYMNELDWRDVPLLSALSFGVSSVEADVNLVNGTLFVSNTYCEPIRLTIITT